MSKGEATRHAILDRALALASTVGLEGLTIGALADDVGMSKSGLFAHFQSKEQLLLATLRHGADRFVFKVLTPALQQPRGEPRLRALFDAWIRWERDELPGGCAMAAAIVEFDDQEGPVRDFLAETWSDLTDSITQMARAGIESGVFRKDLDARRFAFELMNAMAGFRRHSRLLRDPHAESLARASLDALLAAARSPRSK